MICPGANGGRNWPATAVNPDTMVLFVPMVEECMDYTYGPRNAAETAAGGADIHMGLRPRPDSDGNFGRLEAIDLKSQQVLWTHRQRSPIASSALATAGGLVFNGAHDRTFAAFDQATGTVLWQIRLNAAPSASPITYSVGGRQYVAVAAGGGGPFDGGTGALTPEEDSPSGGTTMWVFELPGS
jgi:alcohol dehydrogenase (cytochrome c)